MYQPFESAILTVNPGDRIAKEPQTLVDKAKQIAVDAPDITGDWIKVPTYFIFEYPNGEKKALHHVKDAKEISDAIRLARFEEDENLIIEPHKPHNVNLIPFILVVLLVLFTIPILIGIF
ncbi:hypothetical protein C7B79_02905 [Chroococcidiopsis cubana CCALA 043]|nr:hypothetical protein [Chroococcidiopsidales cyanobacterium LEGE 13417]PSB45891.1 hypothetical protein C7B80_15385 [Cyanosarcina cf. burmensis CCALA 770]PSB66037.1 hypothetical protein C7B79_02905 [Chroococcidiopsis cubana CCALA 043]PSM49508.1 hypothetical protein C7Y66_08980 [Chroococcidiopsis sp. CCALA 051]